jgi:two-component system response regulator BaeR
VPIVMVTAKVEEIERLIGLDLGADDYVCKPFSVRELVARVRAILRRRRAPATGLLLNEEKHLAQLDGRGLDLTPVEFRLLATLAASPGRVFSRAKLLERLYEDHRVVTDRTVDAHIKNLRRKLEAARPGEELVRSIYGVGYKLEL